MRLRILVAVILLSLHVAEAYGSDLGENHPEGSDTSTDLTLSDVEIKAILDEEISVAAWDRFWGAFYLGIGGFFWYGGYEMHRHDQKNWDDKELTYYSFLAGTGFVFYGIARVVSTSDQIEKLKLLKNELTIQPAIGSIRGVAITLRF